MEEGSNWHNVGRALSNAALQREKAIEAEMSGKLVIAQAWREVSQAHQLVGEILTRSIIARARGSVKEGFCLHNACDGLMKAVEQREKALEAEEKEERGIAQARSVVAAKYQQSSEKFIQAANNERGAAEKQAQAAELRIQAALPNSNMSLFSGAALESEALAMREVAARLQAEGFAMIEAADTMLHVTDSSAH